jgi:glycosyltransferase A (GT-A) superfamily protein (DUF2064 family)
VADECDWEYFAALGLSSVIQRGRNIGERMADALEQTIAANFGAAVLVGSDIPGLVQADIEEAFSHLRDVDAVFGPSLDGGFYLVGTTGMAVAKLAEALRSPVRWSTKTVLPSMLKACDAQGIRVRLVAERQDVDNTADWAAFRNSRGGEPS